MIPQRYDVRLRGTLSPSLLDVFRPWTATLQESGTVTVLSGTVHDQAELTGLLTTIDGLGLSLLEVRPHDDPRRSAASPPGDDVVPSGADKGGAGPDVRRGSPT